MGMNICDDNGKWVDLGHRIHPVDLTLPLVSEHRSKYSLPFGDTELVQITFANIYIAYGDMRFKKHRFRFRFEGLPPLVELHFALTGGGKLENHINGQEYKFDAQQHNIIFAPEFDGIGVYDHRAGYKFFEIHFTVDHFIELSNNSCDILSRFTDQVAQHQHAVFAKENLPVTFAMHNCILDIMNCKMTGAMKLLFLQAKCMELLSLQVAAFELAENNRTSSVLRSEHDKACIVHARDHLLAHVSTPPSLGELSKIVGINEFKLKNGFKELFNTTVFGYLSDVKLTQAKEQLLSGTSIKEVTEQLGYASVQHFGTAFRKKFGIAPGSICKHTSGHLFQ